MLFALASITTLTVGFTIFSVISDLNKNKQNSSDGEENVQSMNSVPVESKSRSIQYNQIIENVNQERQKEVSRGR